MNSLLISFDDARLESLINIVLVDWPNLAEKKQAFKFPSIAADILSTPNQKIVDFFTAPRPAGQSSRLEPLLQFFVAAEQQGQQRYNYTRSGYICKILNSLILHRNGLAAKQCLGKNTLTQILESCHCKSASSTILNLITLLSNSVMTPMMMATAPALADRPVEAAISTVASDVVAQTLPRRLDLFREVLNKAIESSDVEGKAELHANLVWIISQVLIKQAVERPLFLTAFFELLPDIIRSFTNNFDTAINNRLGNLLLVVLETQVKEQAKEPAVQGTTHQTQTDRYCIPNLPAHMNAITNATIESLKRSPVTTIDGKRTHSFSSEMGRLNPKVYKVLEAINVGLRFYNNDSEFLSKTLLETDLRHHVFDLFTDHPFNNILHNQVKKLLIIIIEKAPSEVQDAFFSNNKAFTSFMDRLANSPFVAPNAPKKVRQGFIGQTVAFCTALKAVKGSVGAHLSESLLTRQKLAELRRQILRSRIRT